MKRTVKRIIAVLLTAVMLLSVAPMSVFAKGNEPDVENGTQAEIKQTNSLSKMLAEATDMSQVAMDSPYYISEMTFDGKIANVRYYNEQDCLLAVAVYDESTGQMLDSAVELVEAESVTADITMNFDLPEHFLAKAFLLDENNAALCKELVCRTYTTEYEKIASLTVNDFDEDKVVNLDEDEDNNFVVLSNNVISINGTSKVNVLSSSDVENNTYTLTNIDDTVRNLKVGDSFYLDNGDLDNFLAIKIKSITIKGSSAIIVAENTEADDLYECIKIDSVASAGQAAYSSETADEAVEYEGEVDYATEEAPITTSSADTDFVDFSLSHKFKIKEKEYKNKSGKVEGKFSGGVTFSAKIGFSANFSGDYKDVSFTIDPSIKIEIKVTGKIDILKINLGSLGCRPVPPVIIGIEPQFVVRVSGELSVKCEFKFTVGVGYNSKDGFINKCKKPTLDVELKAEVTLFVGFDLQPHVALLSEHVAKITLSGEFGAEAKATMKNISPSSLHSCTQCIDGDLTAKGKIGVKLTFGEDTMLENEYEATLVNLSWKLGNFYYSISHSQFGFGSCPFILHTFTVKVTNSKGSPIEGVNVKTDIKGDTGTKTNAKGEAKITAGCGKVKLTAEASGYKTISRNVDVSEDTVKFYLKLKKAGEPSDGTGSNDSVFTGTEATGTVINFGSYPQSKVTDSAALKKLDKEPKQWESYEYYSGTGSWSDGNMTSSDYMKYADIKLGGEKYRAVTFSEYRPYCTGYNSSTSNSYQDDNGYYTGNTYYFKYEPLKWCVLDASTGLMACDSAIDSQPYNNYVLYADYGYWGDSNKMHYASNWEYSSLRAWLNNEFYNTAFSEMQQDRIKKLTRENKSKWDSIYDSNPTSDKITLLSYDEASNASYGFSSADSKDIARRRKVTDYAKCQGLYVYNSSGSSNNGNSWWWLRSPGSNSNGVADVSGDGGAYSSRSGYVDSADGGVVPVLNLTKSKIGTSSITSGEIAAEEVTDENAPRTSQAAQTVFAPLANGEFTLGSAVDGNRYMVYGVTDYSDGFTLTSDNLVYIDQSEGKDGKVTLAYKPSRTDKATVIVVGDFGSGIEAKKVEFKTGYTVTWNIDGKTVTEIYAAGDKLTPPTVPSKSGYTFKGWDKSVPSTMPASDLTFTAVYEKNVEKKNVKSVSIDDISLNYKKSTTIKPTIKADDGAKYKVEYSTSNAKVATVDQNGKVTATKRGSGTATITCTVTDSNGNVVKDTCKVNVKLSFGQILIVYVLFGWIWY
ncbi:putative RCC1 repeat domain protein [Ruminococcus sp. CAG:563]|nr:putative RCC1 repeat domain protein [Ruminococcus sp. CAG:563]